MRVIETSQRSRRTCIDIIAGGIVYVVDTCLTKFLEWVFFKPIIWLLSHLYDKVHEKIWPTNSTARTPCYGKFICPSCRREWSSVQSWPNVNQQCKKCLTYAHPYEQRPLRPWDTLVSNLTYLRTSPTLLFLVIIIFFALGSVFKKDKYNLNI